MRRLRLAGLVTGCALVPLLVPTVLVLTASLSEGEVLTFPPRGFTIHWYSAMIGNDAIWSALGNSLYVALVSVAINVVCGVAAALVLPNVGRYSGELFTVVLSLGLSLPSRLRVRLLRRLQPDRHREEPHHSCPGHRGDVVPLYALDGSRRD